MNDNKPTNPKDAIATFKLPLHLLSGIGEAYESIALYLGATKYGAHNYTVGGARASIYVAALRRHLSRWWLGENHDRGGTPHLANAKACLDILIEARERGVLVDDRPPSFDLGPLYARLESLMPEIRERYRHLEPKHWTIDDTPAPSVATPSPAEPRNESK